MLSSISSFLPSALQIGNDKSPPPQEPKAQITESPTKDDETEDMAIDEHGVKKKKERTNEVSCTSLAPCSSYTPNASIVCGKPACVGARVVATCNAQWSDDDRLAPSQ